MSQFLESNCLLDVSRIVKIKAYDKNSYEERLSAGALPAPARPTSVHVYAPGGARLARHELDVGRRPTNSPPRDIRIKRVGEDRAPRFLRRPDPAGLTTDYGFVVLPTNIYFIALPVLVHLQLRSFTAVTSRPPTPAPAGRGAASRADKLSRRAVIAAEMTMSETDGLTCSPLHEANGYSLTQIDNTLVDSSVIRIESSGTFRFETMLLKRLAIVVSQHKSAPVRRTHSHVHKLSLRQYNEAKVKNRVASSEEAAAPPDKTLRFGFPKENSRLS
ncbi:hypothetical protein EVAR_6447_1 [Eumeta japonica]|uniref:Uncharacterized protein n=1 Tax=Eumeta variegata TaxID=151549 RepID=A0A4C1SPV5_EUMVA|nr:hypothetical protein EVAR_6447_1 [Eumeta japonica]